MPIDELHFEGPAYAELRAVRKQNDELLTLARNAQTSMSNFATEQVRQRGQLQDHEVRLANHERRIEDVENRAPARVGFSLFVLLMCMTLGVVTGLLIFQL